ncbi:MAG: hypothetical protein ACOC6U_01885 [Thermoplasmatota archaeon]
MRSEIIKMKVRKKVSKNRKGIGGFFTDVPALIVIIIGLSIFTVSIYNFQSNYVEKKYQEGMEEDLKSFMKDIRNYDYISESDGVFYASNLQDLNSTRIREDYIPNSLGFDYKIEVIDNSDYTHKYNKTIKTGTVPSDMDVYVDSTSITIKDYSQYHLGKLKIYIWECE